MRKNQRLIIIGAGGHAKVVASTAQAAGYTVEAIYDDAGDKWNHELLGFPIRGPIRDIPDDPERLAVIGMGDATVRKALCESLNLRWLTLIHPTAYVHPSVELGSGTVVFAGAVLQPDVKVGNHAIVNTGATVDHDCVLEDFVQVAPGVHLSGTVRIDEGAFLGTGVSVLPKIRIGAWSVVGAGAVVIRDLPDNVVVAGCPADVIKPKRGQRSPLRSFPRTDASNTVRVLFTASGRRVSLLRFFRRSGERLGIPIELHAADTDGTSPAWEVADHTHIVPPADSGEFVPAVAQLCRQFGINLIVSLIDPELPVLAAGRREIEETGATLSLSDLATINIAADKMCTYEHFIANGIPTAHTWDVGDGKLPSEARFPLIIKPRFGSSTVDVVTVRSAEEFQFFVRRIDRPCAQELLTGHEYTFDVLVGNDSEPLCIVPRLRIQTRAGETSKGVTLLDNELIAAARTVIESLPGPRGPMNVQAFRNSDGLIRFTEFNPRFGGGFVLSYHAGADFPGAMLMERLNRPLPADILKPRPGVVLLRYDDELVTDLSTLQSRGYELP